MVVCAVSGCDNTLESKPHTNRDQHIYCSLRCRQREWAMREYRNDPAYRLRALERNRQLTGARYALHLLRNRRAKALRRREARHGAV